MDRTYSTMEKMDIPQVVWPAHFSVLAEKLDNDIRSLAPESVELWDNLTFAAREAVKSWAGLPTAGAVRENCIKWLFVVDILRERIGLMKMPPAYPSVKWPLQLQLLGLLSMADSEDGSLLQLAADTLDKSSGAAAIRSQDLSRRPLDAAAASALTAAISLFRFRAVILDVIARKITIIDDLTTRCDEARRGLPDTAPPGAYTGAAASGAPTARQEPPLLKRPRREVQQQQEVASRALAQQVHTALRGFAQKVIMASLETDGAIPVQDLANDIRAMENFFPVAWLRDAAMEASKCVMEAETGDLVQTTVPCAAAPAPAAPAAANQRSATRRKQNCVQEAFLGELAPGDPGADELAAPARSPKPIDLFNEGVPFEVTRRRPGRPKRKAAAP